MQLKHPEFLSEDAAHEEANMLKVKLGEMVGHEPSAADYDNALKAVEEIKKLAKEEPQFDKVIFRIFQIGAKYLNHVDDGLIWIATLGRRPNDADKADDSYQHLFDDAVARLRQLKQKAEELDKNGESRP